MGVCWEVLKVEPMTPGTLLPEVDSEESSLGTDVIRQKIQATWHWGHARCGQIAVVSLLHLSVTTPETSTLER